MIFSYIIFILTLLIFPLFALVISSKVEQKKYQSFLPISIYVFLLHNALYIAGFSFYGDYIDYLIFALEYFTFCLLTFSVPTDKFHIKVLRILGTIGISLGVLVGFVGIIMFIVISQDYESDKKIHFESYGKRYEVRRYTFGFATIDDTRYTFETYRRYMYFPFEYKIDKTDFFYSKTGFDVSDDDLAVYVVKNDSEENLVFKSTDGNFFLKKLKSFY